MFDLLGSTKNAVLLENNRASMRRFQEIFKPNLPPNLKNILKICYLIYYNENNPDPLGRNRYCIAEKQTCNCK